MSLRRVFALSALAGAALGTWVAWLLQSLDEQLKEAWNG